VLQPARDAERQRRDDDLVVVAAVECVLDRRQRLKSPMSPVTSAPAGALAHGLQQSGRRSDLVRDDENGCRLLIHELTSE
jgi:hypothetical protein